MNETRIKKKLYIIIKKGSLSQLEIDNNEMSQLLTCVFYCTLLQLRDAIENNPA